MSTYKPRVVLLTGRVGTGKTMYARQLLPDACWAYNNHSGFFYNYDPEHHNAVAVDELTKSWRLCDFGYGHCDSGFLRELFTRKKCSALIPFRLLPRTLVFTTNEPLFSLDQSFKNLFADTKPIEVITPAGRFMRYDTNSAVLS